MNAYWEPTTAVPMPPVPTHKAHILVLASQVSLEMALLAQV